MRRIMKIHRRSRIDFSDRKRLKEREKQMACDKS